MDNLHQEMRQGSTDQNLGSNTDMLSMTETRTSKGRMERSVERSVDPLKAIN